MSIKPKKRGGARVGAKQNRKRYVNPKSRPPLSKANYGKGVKVGNIMVSVGTARKILTHYNASVEIQGRIWLMRTSELEKELKNFTPVKSGGKYRFQHNKRVSYKSPAYFARQRSNLAYGRDLIKKEVVKAKKAKVKATHRVHQKKSEVPKSQYIKKYGKSTLSAMKVSELKAIAKKEGHKGYSGLRKAQLITILGRKTMSGSKTSKTGKGAKSKTHKGDKDYTTKKGNKDYHQKGKDVKKTKRPYGVWTIKTLKTHLKKMGMKGFEGLSKRDLYNMA